MTDNSQQITKNRNSFTLIELLVVLALVAILSVVVVMTLNPAELLKQARDSNRLSDLATINTSLNLFSSDVVNGFMGTSTNVYVSIPSTLPDCSNLGLPTLPSGYFYSCVTSQNLRNTNGTGWIPVNFQRISSNSPISQLPIDPINTTSTNSYYTYMSGGSWKLTAVSLESAKYIAQGNTDGGVAPSSFEMGNNMSLGQGIFPNGWVRVPGNSTFGTSDFWVMKYEAKCATSTAPGVGLTAPDAGSGYQTYSNSAATCTGVRTIVSIPSGYPVSNIPQSTAGANNDVIEYCQSIGAHLITNNEWQTIAWNTQGVASNWSAGSMSRGNSDSTHASIALDDDNNSTYDTGYTDFLHRRTHTLSNGQVIWDLAGNIYELTNDVITGANQPWTAPAGFGWREYSNITNWGTMTPQTAGPSNFSWGSAQGVGKVYSDGSANATVYTFIRGGDWANNIGAGVDALILTYVPASAYPYVGFRCAK